jgi:hypothetical protein
MGSTPIARTTSKFEFALGLLNGIKGFGVNHGSMGFGHVVGEMGQNTVKPEQEPEQLRGWGFWVWHCVSEVRQR